MLSRRDTVFHQNHPLHTLRVWLSTFVLLTCSSLAQALGLGELRVQSMLGQPLRVSVPVLGHEPDNVLQVCVKAKVMSLDGTFLMALRVSVNTDPRNPALVLSGTQILSEPAVTVLVEVICEANISRQYQILLDPPETALAVAAKIAVPAVPAVSVPATSNNGNNEGNGNNPGSSRVAASGNGDSVTAAGRAEARATRKAARAAARAVARMAALEKKQARENRAEAEATAPAEAGKFGGREKTVRHQRVVRDGGTSLKAAASLSAASGPARNVLKVSGQRSAAQDIAGNALPAATGKPALPLPDGPNLRLLLTRRLASDTSPISKAQVQAFSETVRQEQNSAVLIEVGRAEVRTLQKQIEQLEAELKQARSIAAAGTGLAANTANTANTASAPSVAGSMAASVPASLPAADGPLAAPDAATRQGHTQDWVIGLAALLLMCLLAISWLLWRLLQLRSRQVSFSAGLAPEPVPAAAPLPAMPSMTAPSMLASIFAKAAQSSATAVAETRSKHESGAPLQAPQQQDAGAPHGSKPASSRASPLKPPAHAPLVSKPEPAIRVASASVALPSIDVPPELYKAEKVAQADEPLEFTFPDELELQTEAQAESMQGLHRNSIDYATETEIPTVEEFTDVMYEAEFWISLNKLDKAIAVLEQYTAFENVSSPLPWLFLFDMYRKTDGHDQYAALQRQFQRMFNGKIPDWEDYDTEHQNMGLEHMAGLMARVEAFWMTDEIIPFLENLLVDDRDGTRQGFELGVYRDILFLTDIAREVQKSSEYEKLSSVFKLAPLE